MRNSKSKKGNKKILIMFFIFFLVVLTIGIAKVSYDSLSSKKGNKDNISDAELIVIEQETSINSSEESLHNETIEKKEVEEKEVEEKEVEEKEVEEKKSTQEEVSEEQNLEEEKEHLIEESGQSEIIIDSEKNSVLDLLGIEELPKDALAVIINNPSEEILSKVSNLKNFKYQESNESSLIIPIYNDFTIKVVSLKWDENLKEGEVLFSSEKSTNGFALHLNAYRPCGIPSLKIKIEGNGMSGEYTLAFNGKDGTPDIEYIDMRVTEKKNTGGITSTKRNTYNVPKDAPEIQIIILNSDPSVSVVEVVPSIILLNEWDNFSFDRDSSVEAINMEYKEGEEVPKGKVDYNVQIDFGEFKPETIKLRREYRIITENFEEIRWFNVPIKNNEGSIYSFKLSENEKDAPTNQYVYTLTASWGENSTDYAFCIKVED